MAKQRPQPKVGDRIAAEQSRPAPQRTMPEWAIPTYRRSIELGLIPGYQFTAIPALQRALFFSGQYRVTDKIDRMGYRLKGSGVRDPP